MKVLSAPTCEICGQKITGVYPPRGWNKMTLTEKEDAMIFSYKWALMMHKHIKHGQPIEKV